MKIIRKRYHLWMVIAVLAIVGCQQDDEYEIEHIQVSEKKKIKNSVLTIEATTIPNIINHIVYQQANYIPSMEHQSSANVGNDNPFGTIDLDRIYALVNGENEEDKTYTFSIIPHSNITGFFSNLIVRVVDGEIIRSYINKYIPNEAHIQAHGLRFGVAFSGTIERYTLEETTISSSSFTNTFGGLIPVKSLIMDDGLVTDIIISDDCPITDDSSDTTDNSDTTDGGSGGYDDTGGNPDGNPNNTGQTGNGDQNTDPNDNGDSIEICTWVIVYHDCGGTNGDTPHDSGVCGGDGQGSYYELILDCGNWDQTFTNSNTSSLSLLNDETSNDPCEDDGIIILDPNLCTHLIGTIEPLTPNEISALGNEFSVLDNFFNEITQGVDHEQVRTDYLELLQNNNITEGAQLLINSYNLSGNLNPSLFTIQVVNDDSKKYFLTSGAIGENQVQTITLYSGLLRDPDVAGVIRAILHEFLHVEQKTRPSPIQSQTEREFLAYFNSLFRFSDIPFPSESTQKAWAAKLFGYWDQMDTAMKSDLQAWKAYLDSKFERTNVCDD